MIELDLRPDRKKLQQFGWICLGGFGVIGGLIAIKTGAFGTDGSLHLPVIFWSLALICPAIGSVAPVGLKPLYVLMTLLAFPIGLVVSNVILLLIFLLLITPLALWFRCIGRDELNRKWSREASSYWIKSPESRGPESYYRQF